MEVVITCLHQAHQTPQYLFSGGDGVLGFIAFMCVMHDLLNDVSVDTNMDTTYAELVLKHVLDKHEGASEAVNTLYEEIAEKIGAKGPKRTRKVCEAILSDRAEF